MEKTYYEKNKEKILDYQHKYFKRTQDKRQEYYNKYYNEVIKYDKVQCEKCGAVILRICYKRHYDTAHDTKKAKRLVKRADKIKKIQAIKDEKIRKKKEGEEGFYRVLENSQAIDLLD